MSLSSKLQRRFSAGDTSHVLHTVREAIVIGSFWCAIALPFLYLPLLVSGLETVAQTMAFWLLLVTNVVVLVVGHSHRSERDRHR